MIVNVVGIRRGIDFTTNDGKRITGVSIFVTHEVDGVEGEIAEKFFLSDTKFKTDKLVVPSMIDLQFNRYGKIDSFVTCE